MQSDNVTFCNNKTKMSMKHRLIEKARLWLAGVAMLAVMPLWAVGQDNSVYEYSSAQGSQTIVRCSGDGGYTVTSVYGTDGRTFFIVSDGTTTRRFYTSPTAMGQLHPYGYRVYDVQIEGGQCYFCGTRWKETGGVMYTIDGYAYPEVDSAGFIGRFSLAEALSGGGTMDTMSVKKMRSVQRVIACGSGMKALAITDNGLSHILDIGYQLFAEDSTDVYKSSDENEGFMDMVRSNGLIVTLSRYTSMAASVFHQQMFSLRTFKESPIDTMYVSLYDYKVSVITGNTWTGFTGVAPIRLASNENNNTLEVGYIIKKDGPLKGHFILYNIPYAGMMPTAVLWNDDTMTYRSLLDLRFNLVSGSVAYPVLVLEDSLGQTFLRVPCIVAGSSYYDTTLATAPYRIESVATYNGLYSTPKLFAIGYHPADGKKVVQMQRSNSRPWYYLYPIPRDCLTKHRTHIFSRQPSNGLILRSRGLQKLDKKELRHGIYTYTSTGAGKTKKCEDGTQY